MKVKLVETSKLFLLPGSAVWGEPACAASPAGTPGGVPGGAAGGGVEAVPAAAGVRQRQSCLGGQVGGDEVPGRSGTDGLSAPAV